MDYKESSYSYQKYGLWADLVPLIGILNIFELYGVYILQIRAV